MLVSVWWLAIPTLLAAVAGWLAWELWRDNRRLRAAVRGGEAGVSAVQAAAARLRGSVDELTSRVRGL